MFIKLYYRIKWKLFPSENNVIIDCRNTHIMSNGIIAIGLDDQVLRKRKQTVIKEGYVFNDLTIDLLTMCLERYKQDPKRAAKHNMIERLETILKKAEEK